MKKKLLLMFVLFITVLMFSGCSNGERRIKINNLSFNEPINFIEMKKADGDNSASNGNKWISYRYGFEGYTLRIIWREKQTYADYTKDSKLNYKDKTISGKKAHYVDTDEYSYTVIEDKDDLYIFEYTGSKKNNKAYKNLINSIK